MTAETALKWFLRFLGLTTVPAFIAAVMPQSWAAFIIHHLDPDVSMGIVTTYLFRITMCMYSFVGVQAFMFAADVKRYLPLIRVLAAGAVILPVSALTALFTQVAPVDRTGVFWLVCFDFADGLVKGIVLILLLCCVSYRRKVRLGGEH